jgi:ribosomal-protein-alanine N-acetyltransferase
VQFTLRDFRREDFDILWAIDQKCFAPGISYTRPELAAYIRRRGSFTLVADVTPNHSSDVIEGSSGILGFLVAEAGSRGSGHIITIDVVPAARRSGVGSKLLLAAEEHLRAARCHSVRLETAVDNQEALAFYKRHHYDVVKTVPRYYSNGVDAFVLQKKLLSQTKAS